MNPRPSISAKLPDELAALVAAKLGSTGLTKSQALIEALSAWVGLPVAAPDDRLAIIESRLSALEQRSTPSTPSTGSTVEADGGRWLTTQQGLGVALARGYTGTAAAWRSWSKRNPDQCEAQYQLRHINHGTRSNTAASFEDVGQG